jgi:Ca2+ transporting ATPase
MIKDHNLVRHLDSCETMGNATTICTDKTGTLTTNRMTVVQCFLNSQMFVDNLPNKDQLVESQTNLIATCISINTSHTSKIEFATVTGQLDTQLGDKTECALLAFVNNNLNKNYEEIRKSLPSNDLIHVFTFKSERKTMSTLVKHPNIPGAVRLYCKGAAEVVLSKCNFVMVNETIQPIEKESIAKNVIENMASNGLRTIAVAYKDFLSTDNNRNYEKEFREFNQWDSKELWLVNKLTLLCVFGLQDPLRAEVTDAIRKCKNAGIVVRMITGDNIDTARSIALTCGILSVRDDDFLGIYIRIVTFIAIKINKL